MCSYNSNMILHAFLYTTIMRSLLISYVKINSIQGGPDITCQKNSGSLEGSNKSKKPIFIRSKIMGIN
jgi:hypothetical protein